jgi:hypothetical protein
MTYVRWTVLLLVLSLGTGACGSSSQTSDSDASTDKIIVSELPPAVQSLSVYEVINQHNANWLKKRGPTSFRNPNPIQVYVDRSGAPYGSIESLRGIQASNVSVIKYFDAQAAQFRFGVGNVAGAILVERKGAGE